MHVIITILGIIMPVILIFSLGYYIGKYQGVKTVTTVFSLTNKLLTDYNDIIIMYNKLKREKKHGQRKH